MPLELHETKQTMGNIFTKSCSPKREWHCEGSCNKEDSTVNGFVGSQSFPVQVVRQLRVRLIKAHRPLRMMAFLQMTVETKIFHSVWCSEKCYVQLLGFINKVTQCMGFVQVN